MLGRATDGAGEFGQVRVGVAKDEQFTFKTDFDPADFTLNGEPATVDDAVQVFLDPQLTVNAPDALVEADGHTITVAPAPDATSGLAPDGSQVELNTAGQWGLSDRYYIAELVDPESGEPLSEPRVTMFTVTPDVPATTMTFNVDGHGVRSRLARRGAWSTRRGTTVLRLTSTSS